MENIVTADFSSDSRNIYYISRGISLIINISDRNINRSKHRDIRKIIKHIESINIRRISDSIKISEITSISTITNIRDRKKQSQRHREIRKSSEYSGVSNISGRRLY